MSLEDNEDEKNKTSNGYDTSMLTIEYAVEERNNEIQMLCGHFIHWFTPDQITRDKFVVFVLDVSGSMNGTKLDQLKGAMREFLDSMISPSDYFRQGFISFAWKSLDIF